MYRCFLSNNWMTRNYTIYYTLSFDKIFLWISNPYTDNNSDSTLIHKQIINIGKPFKQSLWFILIASVFLVSIMHIWFTTKEEDRNAWRDKLHEEAYKNGIAYFKIMTVLNVLLDAWYLSHKATIHFIAKYYYNLLYLIAYILFFLLLIWKYTDCIWSICWFWCRHLYVLPS